MFNLRKKTQIIALVAVVCTFLLFQFVAYSETELAFGYKERTKKIYETTAKKISSLYQDGNSKHIESSSTTYDSDLTPEQQKQLDLLEEDLKHQVEDIEQSIAHAETEATLEKYKEQEAALLKEIESLKEQQENIAAEAGIRFKIDIDYEDEELEAIDIVSGNKLFRRFFKKFFAVLTDNKLNYPHPERTTIHNGKPIIWRVMTFEAPVDKLSENELLGLMEFDDGFIKDLKQKHRNVVRAIPDKPPVPFYKGKGYTMVGGGKYSWYALLSVQVLRKVGSLLPVEILIPNDDEYEAEVCENIFPLYNAKCVLMSKVFGKETLKNFELSGYQFKSFALLGSSFDDTFLLDSDTFPVMNPDPLFASPLYKHYEMITWPDFWRRTVSPRYYEVAGIEVGPKPVRHLNDFYTDSKYYASEEQRTNYKEDIPYHDREGTLPDWTTESGELLIRKSTHFNSLLLSLYYNTDGPQGYHPLLSQGGAGEGDKETFVAAAHYYNQPFYQLYKAPDRIFGWHDRSKGTWEHTTIAQYDPLNDFEILKANVKRVEEDIEREGDSYQYIYEYAFRFPWTQDNCKAMFYHVHDPKMDPFLIKEKSVNLDLDDGKIRNLGDLLPGVGFDLEGTIYRNMRYNLCEQKWKFQTFKDQDMKELCAGYLHDHIAYLEKTEKEILAKHLEEHGSVATQDQGFTSQLTGIKELIYDKVAADLSFDKEEVHGKNINDELAKEGNDAGSQA